MGTMLKLEMKGFLREIMKFDADYPVQVYVDIEIQGNLSSQGQKVDLLLKLLAKQVDG